jgi:hypothetical protein
MDQYEKIFGAKPKEYTYPLEMADHPEIDTTDELDQAGIKIYQSVIGSLQWDISLGRFDIQTEVMTMSRFKLLPGKVTFNNSSISMVTSANLRVKQFGCVVMSQTSAHFQKLSMVMSKSQSLLYIMWTQIYTMI